MKTHTYRLKTLETMPTIRQGHTDDLKIETKNTRVWLSRMTIEDGMPHNNQVTVEQYYLTIQGFNRNGRFNKLAPTWNIVKQYEEK